VIGVWEDTIRWLQQNSYAVLAATVMISALIGFFLGRSGRGTIENTSSGRASRRDEAFFKGFQYILSNDHDHAIEEFTKSVQVNSDTIETYVALGNLFRSKGDIERAIRIRQSIILRTNIDESLRLRALFDLGLDYRKGGLINRALGVFLDVLRMNPEHLDTLGELEKIYEEIKDWENAYRMRQKIARLSRGNHDNILAHHQVEMGKMLLEQGDYGRAKSLFEKAVATHKGCVDAYLHLGDLYLSRNEYKKALVAWTNIIRLAPEFAFLSYRRLEKAHARLKEVLPVKNLLIESGLPSEDIFVRMALARFYYDEGDREASYKHVEAVVENNPTFWEARRLKGDILLSKKDENAIIDDYKNLLSHLTMPDIRFQCSECGFQPERLKWQCPQCRKWDTIRMVESSKPEIGVGMRRDQGYSVGKDGGVSERQ